MREGEADAWPSTKKMVAAFAAPVGDAILKLALIYMAEHGGPDGFGPFASLPEAHADHATRVLHGMGLMDAGVVRWDRVAAMGPAGWSEPTAERRTRAPSPRGHVYAIRSTSGYVKIGYTGSSPEKRLAGLQNASAEPLELVWTIPGTRADEKRLHEECAAWHVRGEWFEGAVLESLQ